MCEQINGESIHTLFLHAGLMIIDTPSRLPCPKALSLELGPHAFFGFQGGSKSLSKLEHVLL